MGWRRIAFAPRKYRNYKKWVNSNPDFTILLWLDSKTTSYEDALDFYNEEFKDILNNEFPNRIQFKDICVHANNAGIEFANEYVRYEINRLRPNYGASSDLLRYLILYQFGGAYFDSDVEPSESNSLTNSGIFEKLFLRNTLFVDDDSQGFGKVGNDGFINTQFNPLIQKIFSNAIEHYEFDSSRLDEHSIFYLSDRQFALKNSLPIMVYDYDKATYILNITPFKTGPYCVRKNTVNDIDELLDFETCGSDLFSLKKYRIEGLILKAKISPTDLELIFQISEKKNNSYVSFALEANNYCEYLLKKLEMRKTSSHLEIISVYINTVLEGINNLIKTYKSFSAKGHINPFQDLIENLNHCKSKLDHTFQSNNLNELRSMGGLSSSNVSPGSSIEKKIDVQNKDIPDSSPRYR